MKDNQPSKFDAVLGGQTPPPTNDLVLGGIEGVKHRLKSSEREVQINALSQALDYGKPGLDLVIEILVRSPNEIQRSIAQLMREKGGVEGKQFLLNYNPWLFFTSLEDWTISEANKAVRVVKTPKQIQTFLEKPQAKDLVALVCEIDCDYRNQHRNVCDYINQLIDNYQKLPNLKVLFAGDSNDSSTWERGYSQIYLDNIYPFIKTFPKLEVLHLCGHFGKSERPLIKQESKKHEILQIRRIDGSVVEPKKLKADRLKTLVVEGADLTDDRIAQICQVEYPSLEYLELWLGRKDTRKIVDILAPILSGELCPNLLYLGLIGSENTNAIAAAIANSQIIKSLKVLDLGNGTLSNAGLLALLNCSEINNLHTLNISENRLKPNMLEKLSQLKCQVVAESQFHNRYYRYSSVWE